MADSGENAEFFGRPGTHKGEQAAFPQARIVAVAECGTHAVIDAEMGPYTTSENVLARPLLSRLGPGVLLLADRGFYSFEAWALAASTGAELLWRVKTGGGAPKPRFVEALPDGSWIATIGPPNNAKGAARLQPRQRVRVIDYTIDDGRPNNGETYRLFTTILDSEAASAEELALAYAERWEIEITLDELKTHQRGPRAVLRSKSPELVKQEIWGYLLCHYAIRALMVDSATRARKDPDRVSFVAALHIVRRSIAHTGDFPP